MSNADAFLILGAEVNRLTAMVDRLRAALEEIVRRDDGTCARVARKALANEQDK